MTEKEKKTRLMEPSSLGRRDVCVLRFLNGVRAPSLLPTAPGSQKQETLGWGEPPLSFPSQLRGSPPPAVSPLEQTQSLEARSAQFCGEPGERPWTRDFVALRPTFSISEPGRNNGLSASCQKHEMVLEQHSLYNRP